MHGDIGYTPLTVFILPLVLCHLDFLIFFYVSDLFNLLVLVLIYKAISWVCVSYNMLAPMRAFRRGIYCIGFMSSVSVTCRHVSAAEDCHVSFTD